MAGHDTKDSWSPDQEVLSGSRIVVRASKISGLYTSDHTPGWERSLFLLKPPFPTIFGVLLPQRLGMGLPCVPSAKWTSAILSHHCRSCVSPSRDHESPGARLRVRQGVVQSGEVPSGKGISQEKNTSLVLSHGTSKTAGDAGGRRSLPFFCILPTDCPYCPPAGSLGFGRGSEQTRWTSPHLHMSRKACD